MSALTQSLKFLVGGNAKTISVLAFNPTSSSIDLVKHNNVTAAPSWVEPSVNPALRNKVFYSLSEEGGQALSLDLKEDGTLDITASVPTGGNPAHIHALKDGSGIIATNYMGGSAVYIPIEPLSGVLATSPSAAQKLLAHVTVNVGSVSPALKFTSPYSPEYGPNRERQEASHPHQCIEGGHGDLYVPDLGSDRIWQLKRKGENELEITGQCNALGGAGPRHAAVHPNGKYIYLVMELNHEVLIFPTPDGKAAASPLEVNGTKIVPSEVPQEHRSSMTAGELILNPDSNRVLYVSNRGQVDLNEKTGQHAKGDAIAVLTLNADGNEVENTEIIRTEVNFIRGMALSPDGKYLGLVGQKDGKVAIYEVGGQYGEKITLVSTASPGLDIPTDVTWV